MSAKAKAKGWIGSPGHATVMLLLATVIWGISFPLGGYWQKQTTDCPGGPLLSTVTLIALRTIIALPVLVLFKPSLVRSLTRQELLVGAGLGLLNFIGVFFQVWAQASTTPALSGFLTSLASAWVPIMAYCFFGVRVALGTVFGMVVAILGAAVLQLNLSTELTWSGGEVLTLICSVAFAIIIVLLDRLPRGVRADHLTIGYVGMTGLPALIAAPMLAGMSKSGGAEWLSWVREVCSRLDLLSTVFLLAVLCSVVAYHLMMKYQPRIPSVRAALVYLLEPIWAALFSISFGLDGYSHHLLLGGSLIVLGNVLVELPGWLRQPTPAEEVAHA